MKFPVLFSLKKNKISLRMSSATNLLNTLRVRKDIDPFHKCNRNQNMIFVNSVDPDEI